MDDPSAYNDNDYLADDHERHEREEIADNVLASASAEFAAGKATVTRSEGIISSSSSSSSSSLSSPIAQYTEVVTSSPIVAGMNCSLFHKFF